jgi:hypothetical protein
MPMAVPAPAAPATSTACEAASTSAPASPAAEAAAASSAASASATTAASATAAASATPDLKIVRLDDARIDASSEHRDGGFRRFGQDRYRQGGACRQSYQKRAARKRLQLGQSGFRFSFSLGALSHSEPRFLIADETSKTNGLFANPARFELFRIRIAARFAGANDAGGEPALARMIQRG